MFLTFFSLPARSLSPAAHSRKRYGAATGSICCVLLVEAISKCLAPDDRGRREGGIRKPIIPVAQAFIEKIDEKSAQW
jgi:hypothetical protein